MILCPFSPAISTDARLSFRGEAKTFSKDASLSHNEDSTLKSKNATRSHEIYIDNRTELHGQGILPAGTHTYTFSIPLPLDCPTSLDGSHCYIRYELQLVVRRIWSDSYIFTKIIKVMQVVDLNLNVYHQLPVKKEYIASVGCWPCRKGAIIYTLTVLRGAYVPGQIVNYILLIENQSLYDIYGYVVQFSQIYTLKSKSQRNAVQKQNKWKNVLMLKACEEKCLRLTTRRFESKFIVPPTIPTTLSGTQSIIRIEYQIKIKVQVSGSYGSHRLMVPIVIGTIPLRQLVSG